MGLVIATCLVDRDFGIEIMGGLTTLISAYKVILYRLRGKCNSFKNIEYLI
jgi:hypothetical protein